ncbi:MAG TPA: ABC transporter ATP-binding protein [Thermomicrobiales bacterium]|nr:ABC transporter ATP-binding protein [Thermomicrobiales bacterium]
MGGMIATVGLTKDYNGARGIRDVTLDVAEGEIFGFLGPNGAGKTTTIRCLMGLLRPTAGRATIAGLDCWAEATAVKRLVGYLPGEFACDPSLTGAQIITYLANLRGGVDQTYVQRLLERLELDSTKRFRANSRGNKQKVGLVQAFMHRPRLLVLDEPTGGLDPLNQQTFYDLVAEAHAGGATVFLSSHILPEVEHICYRVGIIREGELVAVDQVAALKDLRQRVVEITFPAPVAPDRFASLPGVREATAADGGHTVRLTVAGDLREILQVAAANDATNLVAHEPSLEEIFLRYYAPSEPVGASAER